MARMSQRQRGQTVCHDPAYLITWRSAPADPHGCCCWCC